MKIKEEIKRLNVGSGKDYKKGYINLEGNKDFKADYRHDLSKFPYPFKGNYFDEVYCSHILEHFDNFYGVFNEILRITKIGGVVHIRVPHFSNGMGFATFDHKRFFAWETFEKIKRGNCNPKYNNFEIIFKRLNYLSKRFFFINWFLAPIFNTLCRLNLYERFFCWIIPVHEVEVKLKKIR